MSSTVFIAATPAAREHAIDVLTRHGIILTQVDTDDPLRLYHAAGVRSRQQLAATQARLTRREFDVVQCLAQGLTSRQIGRCVGRTDSAIKDCLRSVYRKLGANDRAHAVLIACRLGILGGGS